ncbi:MAG: hypothetical protein AAGF31_00860 [Planctomycetota bacterium]
MSAEEFDQQLKEQQQTIDTLMELNGALTTRYLAVLVNQNRETTAKHGARLGSLENQVEKLIERLDKAGAYVRQLELAVANLTMQQNSEGTT